MSRAGNPYDNAKAERFMRTLKDEEVNGKTYASLEDARQSIGAFLETIYNRARRNAVPSRDARRKKRNYAGIIVIAS